MLYNKNWTILVGKRLREYEDTLLKLTKINGYDGKEVNDKEKQWSFSGALLYSVTVITTIGKHIDFRVWSSFHFMTPDSPSFTLKVCRKTFTLTSCQIRRVRLM